MFNPVAPYGYLLPTVYLLWQISQIQTCLCVVVGPGFVLTPPDFMSLYKCVSVVTAPPFVGSVIWSQKESRRYHH